jgi:hypothetical protein
MLDIFPYIAGALGFMAVFILNGIKSEIREVKNSLAGLERDMREGVASLDRRVTRIEARCDEKHGAKNGD